MTQHAFCHCFATRFPACHSGGYTVAACRCCAAGRTVLNWPPAPCPVTVRRAPSLSGYRAVPAEKSCWNTGLTGIPSRSVRAGRHRHSSRNNSLPRTSKSTDLNRGPAYSYRVKLNGKPVTIPGKLMFHTQPLWEWRSDPPAFRVVAGSCAYINDAAYDRPGKPYGDGYRYF